MTVGLSKNSGPIIELGPGTGAITREILARGVYPHNLAAIELGAAFAQALRQKHPDIHVIEGDASEIADLSPFAKGTVGQIVCGLPLISLPVPTVEQVLINSFEAMKPDGAFRLFTYAPRCPVRSAILMQLSLRSQKISSTLRNLPPAYVYELRRAG